MISTLAMPVAPESPSSQHNAPAAADQRPHPAPAPGHQRTSSGGILLSELAAAASAAPRGVILPPLRSLVEPSAPQTDPASAPARNPNNGNTSVPPVASLPLPTMQQAPASGQVASGQQNSNSFLRPPVIALSQAPAVSRERGQTGVEPATAGDASESGAQSRPRPASPRETGPSARSEHLQAPLQAAPQAANASAPALRVPSPSRSSISSVGSHDSAVSPVTPTATAPVDHEPMPHQLPVQQDASEQSQPPKVDQQHQVSSNLGPPIAPKQPNDDPGNSVINQHRVLAPAPPPIMPSPQAGMTQPNLQFSHGRYMSNHVQPPQRPEHQPEHQHQHQHQHQHRHAHPHQQHLHQHHPHQQEHPHQAQGMVAGMPNAALSAAIPSGGIPSTQNPALRSAGTPQIVYVNPYGYPVESVPYLYPTPPVPHPHYGYAAQHAGYPNAAFGTPMPLMQMPSQPQQVVNSLGRMPHNSPVAPPNMQSGVIPRTGAGGPIDMKNGMQLHPHMMQPWSHTFSQEIKRRTRTGCLTCRRRRVKCDEQHPQCRNCLKSERVCLGYDVIFSFDRAKRVDHLMHRRRVYRASRSSRLRNPRDVTVKPEPDTNSATLLDSTKEVKPETQKSGQDAEEERSVLRTWLSVVEAFRSNVAGPLDEMLGSDMFMSIARRTADYLNAADQRFVNVAGELEAMRQLLAVIYPSFSFEGLNILESQIALEKLRTTEDYCLLRGVAECLTSDESAANMQELISPTAAVRRTIHQQHLQRVYLRLALLHRVLHPQRGSSYGAARPEAVDALGRAAQSVLMTGPNDERTEFTEMMWSFVEEAMMSPSGGTASDTAGSIKAESLSALARLAGRNDSRAILALLALYARRSAESDVSDLLNAVDLRGLPMALLEIGMAYRS